MTTLVHFLINMTLLTVMINMVTNNGSVFFFQTPMRKASGDFYQISEGTVTYLVLL